MRGIFLPALLGIATPAFAALFDVTSLTNNGLGTLSYASGTSNGVAFEFSGSIFGMRTHINEEFEGFSGVNFVPPMPHSDCLHTGGLVTTFTFAQPIASALVYLSDDDGALNGYWDFGVAAEVVSGDVEVVGNGFRTTQTYGGVVRLSNINATTLVAQSIGDGNDFAIVVTPVPEPLTWLVMGAGLLALKRKRSR